MKKVDLSLIIILLFIFALASATWAFQNEPEGFQNEPEGFRGVKWGDPPGEDMINKTKDRDNPNLLWYMRKNDKLQLGVVKLKSIYYIFYKGQFMEAFIETEKDYDSFEDIVKLKFGCGEPKFVDKEEFGVGGGTGFVYEWSGVIATVILWKKCSYRKGEESKGILKIRSTIIYNQKKADEYRKKRKAAEEGLADFDYIPATKEEKKESNIKEKLKTEKVEPEVQPFFDLSTPENTVRSFIEAIVLEDDNKKAVECWSRRVPEFLTILLVNVAQEAFREGFKEVEEKSPEVKSIIQNPEIVKFGLNLFSYEKEQIDAESFYVWYVAPDGSNSKEDLNFRVVKEDGDWKILMWKGMEDNPLFRTLLEKVEATERKFKDFSTPENTLRTFLEATALRDRELMKQCWSKEVQGWILDKILEDADSISAEYDLEARKTLLGRITYKVDKYIDDNTCYVYSTLEGEESPVKFKVKKEEDEWKILMPVEEEENKESGEALEKSEIEYLGPAKRKEERAPLGAGEGRGRAIKKPLGGGGRKIERCVEPPYPEWAQREEITGVVELKCWVLPSGDVRNVEVYRSSGSPRLDEHARQYLLMWKFEPIEEEKIQWGIVPFRFEFPEE